MEYIKKLKEDKFMEKNLTGKLIVDKSCPHTRDFNRELGQA